MDLVKEEVSFYYKPVAIGAAEETGSGGWR